MNLIFPRRSARLACVLLFGALTAFGVVGCADTYTTAPVYRGAYYAYDAYPYGYRGYPAYPYYGAPFGGGASVVIAERGGYGYRRGYGDGYGYRRGDNDDRYRRNHPHNRRPRQARQSGSYRNGGRADVETVRPQ